jgi:WD40 repeat protein
MQVLGEIGGESLLSVALMPDSGIIAAGGDLGTLYLWDQDSNQLLMQITQAHQDAINSLKFSPTDRLLATGGADGLVKLWRLQ